MKRCTKCKQEKSTDRFYKYKRNKDGISSWCRDCTNKKSNETTSAKILNDRQWYLWTKAKQRAKEQGIIFALQPSDIHVPIYCPALGIKLKDTHGPLCAESPTLDKIIPSLGYVPGNVVVVSHKANRMKNDATVNELNAVASFYTKLTDGILNAR